MPLHHAAPCSGARDGPTIRHQQMPIVQCLKAARFPPFDAIHLRWQSKQCSSRSGPAIRRSVRHLGRINSSGSLSAQRLVAVIQESAIFGAHHPPLQRDAHLVCPCTGIKMENGAGGNRCFPPFCQSADLTLLLARRVATAGPKLVQPQNRFD